MNVSSNGILWTPGCLFWAARPFSRCIAYTALDISHNAELAKVEAYLKSFLELLSDTKKSFKMLFSL